MQVTQKLVLLRGPTYRKDDVCTKQKIQTNSFIWPFS